MNTKESSEKLLNISACCFKVISWTFVLGLLAVFQPRDDNVGIALSDVCLSVCLFTTTEH